MQKIIDLTTLSEEEILNLRICDLPLQIEGTWLKDCLNELFIELENKGIRFKPAYYLADEWLAPDQEPVTQDETPLRLLARQPALAAVNRAPATRCSHLLFEGHQQPSQLWRSGAP